VSIFDNTLAASYRWLDHLGSNLGWRDRERSYQALRAVLHALRDRTTRLGSTPKRPSASRPRRSRC
jgi:uncharacterized protein (DUF2267 family)